MGYYIDDMAPIIFFLFLHGNIYLDETFLMSIHNIHFCFLEEITKIISAFQLKNTP